MKLGLRDWSGYEKMFEMPQDEGILRRIAGNASYYVRLAIRPLRRRRTWQWMGVNAVMGFVFSLLYLHYIGARRWHPDFHRVTLTYRDAALQSIPVGIFVGFGTYLSRVWSE